MRIAAAILIVLALSSCRTPGQPPPTVTGVIDCSAEAIRKCFPAALGSVNTCLASSAGSDWRACLISLIQPTACGVESVTACLVRSSGSSAAADAQANPDDVVSQRIAERSKAWVSERNYTFAE